VENGTERGAPKGGQYLKKDRTFREEREDQDI